MSASRKDTICPSCEAAGGELASPCDNIVCRKNGIHFIPLESYRRRASAASRSGQRIDSEVGRLVAGRYLVTEKLGQGGMGAVYLALQLPLRREVALKMILGLELDEDARQRFEREATSISILYHPNIVGLSDYGIDGETRAPFMVLEYVKGGRTLEDLMEERARRGDGWRNDEIAGILVQVLSGLAVAHRSGLVHRDIKPANIMLVGVEGNPNFVKILDFGLAKALQDIPGMTTLTVKGAVLGTPQYMAPEQVASKEDIDHRCDLYAVGAILFEMATGLPCCSGRTTNEIFYTKLSPGFDPFTSVPAGSLSPALEEVLRKALAKEPSERYGSAGEMKAALVGAFGIGERFQPDEELVSRAPTLSADSLKEGAAAAKPAARPGESLTRDAGSVVGAKPSAGGKKKILLWAGVAGAAVLVALLAIYFGPWKRGAQDRGDGPAADQKEKPRQEATAAAVAALAAEPDAMDAALQDEPAVEAFAKVAEKGEPPQAKKTPIPKEPPQKAVDAELRKVRKAVENCSKGAKGNLKLLIGFEGDTGTPHSKYIEGSLNTGDEFRSCLWKTVDQLKVPRFAELTYVAVFKYQSEGSAGTPDAGE
jgi:serine/threonine protein kinase